MYEKRDTSQIMILVPILIIGITIGFLWGSGRGSSPNENDTDEINIPTMILDTNMDNVDRQYFLMSGIHLDQIGNKFDRYATQIYTIKALEVNRWDYIVEVSYEGAETYLLRIDPVAETGYIVLENRTEYGEFSGGLGITVGFDYQITTFFYGVNIVSFDSTFYHS